MPDPAGRAKAFISAAVHRLHLEPCQHAYEHHCFSASFALRDNDEMHPAGDYKIPQDEESTDLSEPSHRRFATFICMPSIASGSRSRRIVRIDVGVLQHLLATTTAAGLGLSS